MSDDKEAAWREAMTKAGHKPVVAEDGLLDILFYEHGTHNGPGCSLCGWSVCWHCCSVECIEECTGHE